jgi:hypothetical protein
MRVSEHEQGSPGWFTARCGIPTASSFDRIITAKTGKKAAAIEKYINQLVGERGTGRWQFTPETPATRHGKEHEPIARKYYEFLHDTEVFEIGLCLHDDLDAGASPDGLIGDDGLLEIKCPFATDIHIGYLRGKVLPDIYRAQVMGQLWVTEREWCDFFSYHTDFEPLKVRVYRDEKFISSLAQYVEEMLEQIEELTEKYKRKDK